MSGPALTGPVQVVATLRPLSREALRLVIDGPARLADIDVDEHLVARPAGLLRLFTVDEQGRPTRWRVNRADLPTQVVTELDTFVFVARRLLTTDSDNGTTVIGVAATAPAVGAPAPSCQSCSSSPWLAPGSRSIDGGTVVLWNVADPTRPR
ncbi:MAG: hypothetical protein ACRDTE_24605, partial [Pseudonocardiaceae bacterium]